MRWASRLGFAVLLAACAAHHPPTPTADAAALALQSGGDSERDAVARRFCDIVLSDQTGRRVHVYEDLVRDQLVVINFMFATCTGTCPGTSANLIRVQRLVGEGVRFISISLDPESDTPEVLAEYARGYGAGPGWSFLTGDEQEIERLRVSLGFFDRDPEVDADRTQHAGILLCGNEPRGRWCHMPSLANPESIAAAVLRLRH